jgi:23S rRNA pseudouridine1911/1915/1917 synthase
VSGGTERIRCETGAERLDRLLADQPSVGTRRRAREALESGKITLDGRVVTAEEGGLPVPAGATVEIHWTRPGTSRAAVRSQRGLDTVGLRILFEDRDVVVVDKPPGLLTDTAGEQQKDRDSVVKRLGAWLQARGGEALVCHRIDRDTSGVVVLARHAKAHEKLREAFGSHVPERTYLAFVHGVVSPAEQAWTDVMRWDRKRLLQVPCGLDAPGAMEARASATVLATWRDASLLEVRLDTGRRNQIRLQASLRGHPLVGERLYLPADDRKARRVAFPRQALHAWKVAFPHPSTGGRVEVEAPIPPDLVALRQRLDRDGALGTAEPRRRG